MSNESSLKKLVPRRSGFLPSWKPQISKAMSVLIGIICPEAIVLAADSHITTSSGLFESVDKISVIRFWPGEEILVAQAGLWALTNLVVDIIRKKATGTKIISPDTVLKIVEDSVREAKFPLDKEQQEIVDQDSTGLMVAFYIGKTPHIYTIEIMGNGIAVKAHGFYAKMGAGDYLSHYLLGEYAVERSHSDLAIATAIFVIRKVKDTVKWCGGDTTIKRMVPLPVYGLDALDKQYIGKSEKIGKDFVDLAEARLIKFDERTKQSRDRRVFAILKKTGSELWGKHLKRVKAEERLNSARQATEQDLEDLKSGKPVKF